MLLKRRYIKSWVIGEGDDTQYGLSVFEAGKGEWSGSTVMAVKPNRLHEQRRKYIEDQREGFLLYRRRPESGRSVRAIKNPSADSPGFTVRLLWTLQVRERLYGRNQLNHSIGNHVWQPLRYR
ncbi:PBECR2 nuclease fold domain-containing protein, partial [Dentiradicibacter hellwigii]